VDNTPLIERLSQQIPVFSEFIVALRDSDLNAWLVGGCVRDLLLDKECADVDIVSSEDPSDWARSWAKGRGRWFWLDEQRKQSRILLAGGISFDFAPLRAATITDDLKARDYTINAIAIAVNDPANLFDPLGGITDLNNRCLRMCSVAGFIDDPLRMLKGVRHAAVLSFTVEKNTIHAMIQQAQLLKLVAAERIREELLKIFVVRDLSGILQLLTETTIFQVLFGAPATNWTDTDFAVNHQSIDDRFMDFCSQTSLTLGKVLPQQRPLFHLAAFLIAYAPHSFKPISSRLRLSRAQQRLAKALYDDLPALWLQQLNNPLSDRQRALAVEQLHPGGAERIFFHGWCRQQLPDDLVIALLSAYEQQQEEGRIPDLVDGEGVAAYVGANNPAIGKLLQQVKSLEMTGELKTRAAALAWLQSQHFGFDKN